MEHFIFPKSDLGLLAWLSLSATALEDGGAKRALRGAPIAADARLCGRGGGDPKGGSAGGWALDEPPEKAGQDRAVLNLSSGWMRAFLR
jgi:hypothetical protein